MAIVMVMVMVNSNGSSNSNAVFYRKVYLSPPGEREVNLNT